MSHKEITPNDHHQISLKKQSNTFSMSTIFRNHLPRLLLSNQSDHNIKTYIVSSVNRVHLFDHNWQCGNLNSHFAIVDKSTDNAL